MNGNINSLETAMSGRFLIAKNCICLPITGNPPNTILNTLQLIFQSWKYWFGGAVRDSALPILFRHSSLHILSHTDSGYLHLQTHSHILSRKNMTVTLGWRINKPWVVTPAQELCTHCLGNNGVTWPPPAAKKPRQVN